MTRSRCRGSWLPQRSSDVAPAGVAGWPSFSPSVLGSPCQTPCLRTHLSRSTQPPRLLALNPRVVGGVLNPRHTCLLSGSVGTDALAAPYSWASEKSPLSLPASHRRRSTSGIGLANQYPCATSQPHSRSS